MKAHWAPPIRSSTLGGAHNLEVSKELHMGRYPNFILINEHVEKAYWGKKY